MAKLPKVPKSVLKKTPSKPPPMARPRVVAPPTFGRPSPIPAPSSPSPSPSPLPSSNPKIGASPGSHSRVPKDALTSSLKERVAAHLASPEHQAKITKSVSRWQQRALFGMGLAAFGIGLYTVQLYMSLVQDPPSLPNIPADLTDRFDHEAEGYDEKVNVAERLLLISSKRKQLTAKAHGHVLEVAVGTGRNFPYYNTKQCETVTLLDVSAPMLAVARRKWTDTHPEYFHRVNFKRQSALNPIVPPFDSPLGYDTVLQTMGLCSTPEPVKLLRNLEAAAKEDGGRILLLEHGKSHYEWLNNILDRSAPAHANEHGCWWNKDIGAIVEESGLEVVEIKRSNFGTTWWVELKPRKGMRKMLADGSSQAVELVEDKAAELASAGGGPWWKFW